MRCLDWAGSANSSGTCVNRRGRHRVSSSSVKATTSGEGVSSHGQRGRSEAVRAARPPQDHAYRPAPEAAE